jgi:excinuclease ABC subunit C
MMTERDAGIGINGISAVWHNQDVRFRDDFLKAVPCDPGVYEMLDADGRVIYVGKAKRLRRRLQQYRNAKRRKKHYKMRTILRSASDVRLHPCASELEALMLENRLIQEKRPRFNVAGAFSFLYPLIGLRRFGAELHLTCTTSPLELPLFEHFGAYRSRYITREAYFGLVGVLGYLGHREPAGRMSNAYAKPKYSHIAGFRQIRDDWHEQLMEFLRGESARFLESAIYELLEKPSARREASQVQEWLDSLARFFKFEAKPLRQALSAAGSVSNGISQTERDRLFIGRAWNARSS